MITPGPDKIGHRELAWRLWDDEVPIAIEAGRSAYPRIRRGCGCLIHFDARDEGLELRHVRLVVGNSKNADRPAKPTDDRQKSNGFGVLKFDCAPTSDCGPSI